MAPSLISRVYTLAYIYNIVKYDIINDLLKLTLAAYVIATHAARVYGPFLISYSRSQTSSYYYVCHANMLRINHECHGRFVNLITLYNYNCMQHRDCM